MVREQIKNEEDKALRSTCILVNVWMNEDMDKKSKHLSRLK